MAFIDSTYFTGELLIPNASSDTQLTQAITQYEKEVLIRLLGYKLYSLLQADLLVGVPQTQKYIDLVDGKEFDHIYDGTTYKIKWEGLKNTAKNSLIAYYVYFNYVDRHVVDYHGGGFAMASQGKDWLRVNPSYKLSYVWERMRTLYGKIPAQYKAYFDQPLSVGDMPDPFDAEPSAYNFLYTNSDDYPDWVFNPLWNINAFGI